MAYGRRERLLEDVRSGGAMVEQVPFPESVAALGLLDHVSYRDAFVAPTTESRTAEEWMRLAIDCAPPGLLRGVRVAQTLLGLKLAPPSYDHPIGWRILRNEPDVFILGAEGPGGSARLVGTVAEGQLTFTTQAEFGLRTRLLWLFVQYPHRAIARSLLSRAVRKAAAVS